MLKPEDLHVDVGRPYDYDLNSGNTIMSNPLSVSLEDRTLSEFVRAAGRRGPSEVEIPEHFGRIGEQTEEEYRAARDQSQQEYEEKRQQTVGEFTAVRQQKIEKARAESDRVADEFEAAKRKAIIACDGAVKLGKKKLEEAHWEATTIFDAKKDEPGARLHETLKSLEDGWNRVEGIRSDLQGLLQKRRMWTPDLVPLADPSTDGADLKGNAGAKPEFDNLVEQIHERAIAMADLRLPWWFQGVRPAGTLILLCSALGAAAGLAAGEERLPWIVGAVVAAVLIWSLGGIWLFRRTRRRVGADYRAWAELARSCGVALQRATHFAESECERQSREIYEQFDSEMQRASDAFLRLSSEQEAQKQQELARLEGKYPALFQEMSERHEAELEQDEKRHEQFLERLEASHHQVLHELGRQRALKAAETDRQFKQAWTSMADAWKGGLDSFETTVEAMNAAQHEAFPDWSGSDWERWKEPASIPPAVCFGRYAADLSQVEYGIPQDDRLMPSRTQFTLPAVLPFPERSLLLLKSDDAGRPAAIEVIQSAMLRLLTSLPPGKVRYTIIDPVGLGENFSAFMHLADYDEQLVASRIWTEAAHIERRLTDLTEQMETVIQVYLRNEFETIQEYNDFAGELAEPYRILVIANFPSGFSEAAAKRLTSIVTAGARCGIYTIMNVDPKQRMPRDFHLSDLEAHAFQLACKEGTFVWEHGEFGPLPLELDRPPEPERFTELVRTVGGRVKDADRVEVPFSNVVPDRDAWWTEDSRRGIDVPLGRAGATKLQHLRLGQGTSQHVLIAGKTGSGKSTLLHALITSSALRYSPNELEFYLIDFKKGVEFKAYAAFSLPHAKVVAIESEREFGLSVLERLDHELKRRGDMFRRIGVQDVRGYRAAEPDARMPRILLIIDEFQELFIEEDNIAQSAGLLLDRLVRQGRAFGIHVMLGSQTLAGAYSLARSTLGQMAVRIALQCSESDAHLILSEENTAARLLTRPGEAIYNDANGLFEGNHPFQVVWLPDHEREQYLRELDGYAKEQKYEGAAPIVFEGNIPADPRTNVALARLLQGEQEPEFVHAPQAWLGAAVAIKEPTSVPMVRQSGGNLLLVGHREEAALGVLATSLVALAAQDRPQEGELGRYVVLDGTRVDAPEAGFWPRFARQFGREVTVATPRDATKVIAEVDEEVRRRQETGIENAPPIFVVAYDLARFRDLRRDEDDFGFSMGEDKPVSPGKQFANILREGPPVGVHLLMWCDSYNNAIRALDRQGLRDVDYRVVFQMNATDSSNLIDTPLASRLGVHRAILYHEGRGTIEKFRPYGLPTDEWMAAVRGQLAAGHAAPNP
ncbi:MAG: cell division protein FtsK [Planctomycetaceae bacterium]|nr:cell division protein FtsK [Planctomycetaceae bacterium]